MARTGNKTAAQYSDFIEEAKETKAKKPRKSKSDIKTAQEKRIEIKDDGKTLEQMSKAQESVNDIISHSYSELLPKFIEERKIEFEKLLNDFEIENEVVIETQRGKVNTYKLSNMLSKPMFINGFAISKISAYDLMTYAQCYWECVGMAAAKLVYVPTLEQMCGLMGISVVTFRNYQTSSDPSVREAVQMIFDKFVDYYTVKGMTNELNSIMAMFTLKARYGLRDNDTPQMVVNNYNNTISQGSIDELEKKYGLDDNSVIDMEV